MLKNLILRKSGSLIAVFMITLAFTVNVFAEPADQTVSDTIPYIIDIGGLDSIPRGSDISIPVYKIAGSEPIRQFEFALSYDRSASTFLGLTPGELYDIPGDFEWEHLSFQEESFQYPIFDSAYPPRQGYYLHITGIPDTANEPHQPLELVVPDSTILFYLNFHVSYNITFAGLMLPLYFSWNDCEHNIIKYGHPYYFPDAAISDKVFVDFPEWTTEITDPYYNFPSLYGALNTCLDSIIDGVSDPSRFIDYYSGYIDIAFDTVNLVKGDINLNGVPYEIDDYNKFSNYFINGTSVFTISADSQITATDINGDRHPLGITDYVYLARILSGDMEPGLSIESSSYGVVNLNEEVSSIIMRTSFGIPAASMYLCFYAPDFSSYNLTLLPHAEHMQMDHTLRNDSLFIFIHSPYSSSIANGTLSPEFGEIFQLNYSGPKPRLAFSSASGYFGENIVIPQYDGLDGRGDINLNGISNEIADAVVFANYFLYGLEAFTINVEGQIGATDINADGMVLHVTDYVYLKRIIEGLLLPYAKDPIYMGDFLGNLYLVETDSSILIRSNFEQPVDALHLVFNAPDLLDSSDYSIIVHPGIDPNMVAHNINNGSLKIFMTTPIGDTAMNGIIGDGHINILEIHYNGAKPEYGQATAAGVMAEWVDITVHELQEGESIPFEIKIGSMSGVIPGGEGIIAVTKTAGDLPMGGFDFLIGFDTTYISLATISPGELFLNCYPDCWYYFNSQSGQVGGCNENCPTGMIRVVGMPGQYASGYYDVDDGTVLFKFRFNIKDSIPYDVSVPIQFYWVDCGDNAIASEDNLGDFLALSDLVFEYNGLQINDSNAVSPTGQGANSSCFNPLNPDDPQRLINFYNGKIGIAGVDMDPFSIKIDRVYGGQFGQNISFPVLKREGSHSMAGFDFLIGYNADMLTAVGATPGELFETPGDYEWEYFNYRFDSFDSDALPLHTGIIRVVGLADMYNGIPHATSQFIEDSTVMFYLDFQVTDDTAYQCQFATVDFIWIDCGDNAIAFGDPNGDSLALSSNVINIEWMNIANPNYGFPTLFGAPDICFDGNELNNTFRAVNYYSSGVDIMCTDVIDDRGDVNLNGIANEIADHVVFTMFFLYGLEAFTINLEGQIAATDIYPDGQVLTLQDLVYLCGVIIGDFLPYPSPDKTSPGDTLSGSVDIINTDSSIYIGTNFTDSIGAIYLTFYVPDYPDNIYNDIYTYPNIDSNIVGYNLDDDTLKILITEFFVGFQSPYARRPAAIPGSHSLIEIPYTDIQPIFITASAAGYRAEYVDLTINTPPPEFDAYPGQLTNNDNGIFRYQFNASDIYGIDYHSVSGPGDIDTETGEWAYAPVCEEIGNSYTLEICASDKYNPCPQSDPDLHATIELSITDHPPIMGDINNNGSILLNDITQLIAYLYSEESSSLLPIDLADVDNNGNVNLLDITFLINYLFKNGPAPECP